MSIFSGLINKLENYKASIPEYIRLVIVENEHIIVDMNAQIQLYEQGVNRLGEKIDSYAPYKPITIKIKRLKNQPTNRVTLRDEGDFEASFKVIANNISFMIDATDPKTNELIHKYGEQILGLTDENAEELAREYIYPELLTRLKDLL